VDLPVPDMPVMRTMATRGQSRTPRSDAATG
jgi:hypothetical protein